MSDPITNAVEIDERDLDAVKGGAGQCSNNLKQIGLAVHNVSDAKLADAPAQLSSGRAA